MRDNIDLNPSSQCDGEKKNWKDLRVKEKKVNWTRLLISWI